MPHCRISLSNIIKPVGFYQCSGPSVIRSRSFLFACLKIYHTPSLSLDGHDQCFQFPVFVHSSPDSSFPIDTLIIVGAIMEQPAVLMAWSLIHTDTKQWWAITTRSSPARPVTATTETASILNGGPVIVVGGKWSGLLTFFGGKPVSGVICLKKNDSYCDKYPEYSHQYEWTSADVQVWWNAAL